MALSVSLKHIAEAAGVTRTTVSLALRNHPRISAAVRKRVQAIAADLGYVPNAEVAKVMGMIRENRPHHDRPVLGLITDSERPMAADPAPRDTWRGFCERARELGYRPEEFWLGDGKISAVRLQKILHTRGIRGFVVSALRDAKLLAAMDFTSFAAAVIGHSMHEPELHRASSDKYVNTVLSCEKLWAMGCRRIGLAVPKFQEERVENTFLAGYLVFHHRHSHSGWRTPLVDEEPWNGQRIAKWAYDKRVDALVVAYGGLQGLLPDMPLAQVNILNGAGMGINQRHDLIAAGAVGLVDAQMRRNESGIPSQPKTMLVPGEWLGAG